MKKLVLLTAVVLTTISSMFAKNDISINDINRSIPINLRASVLSVPSPLNSSYANGDVTFYFCATYAKKCNIYTRPYTGLGNYDVNLSVSWVPETVNLTVNLDITTKDNSGQIMQLTWWNGKATASHTFKTYQTIFGINIYETNFYHLEQDGYHWEEDYKSDIK